MSSSPPWYRWDGDALLLRLRVQPRAGRTAFAEPFGDSRKIKLKAPPVDGRANAELVKFLAESFGVARADIVLVSGKQGRTKELRIESPTRLPPEIER
jgi:hypothetical protein